jgi:hypothetical protein
MHKKMRASLLCEGALPLFHFTSRAFPRPPSFAFFSAGAPRALPRPTNAKTHFSACFFRPSSQGAILFQKAKRVLFFCSE